MSVLFDPYRIGPLEVKNRFVRSATIENRAEGKGGVTSEILSYYTALARGELGTIITGVMYVRADGKGSPTALGIDRDDLLPGLRELATTIKGDGSRAIFQLHHAGGQAFKADTGGPPRSASRDERGRVVRMIMGTRRPLAVAELQEITASFAAAAVRAREAGADGIQIHAAHGYLLSELLSPAFNRRDDAYGGSDEGRYRLLGEIVTATRAAVGDDFALMVKMNVDDGVPVPAMTPALAATYAGWMARDSLDCLELSAGCYAAPFVMARGEHPIGDFASVAPWPFSRMLLKDFGASALPPFTEAYNAPRAAPAKAALGRVPLALVGGMRTLSVMEDCVTSGTADLISLSRPLIREPGLVSKYAADPLTVPACISCNRCMAGFVHGLPTRCYVNGLPAKKGKPRE